MGLEHRTVRKLFREDFPAENPITVDPSEREGLGQQIKTRLERFERVDTKDTYVREEETPRLVCCFSIREDPPYQYYGRNSFRLLLDDQNQLTINHDHYRDASTALVSDMDEIVRFVQHCEQRLARRKALQTKRDKVRQLKAQAIVAQVKKLAKEEKFDFLTENDPQKLRLYVKLSDEHAVELGIPFKQFDEMLPQLRTTIVSLRQLYDSGIRFRIVGRAKVPRRKEWIKHETLE